MHRVSPSKREGGGAPMANKQGGLFPGRTGRNPMLYTSLRKKLKGKMKRGESQIWSLIINKPR